MVGAGRGPLVKASLSAVRRYNAGAAEPLQPEVLAVEKNPAAVVFLNSLVGLEPGWEGVVRVLAGDMREASIPNSERADIVVSEVRSL